MFEVPYHGLDGLLNQWYNLAGLMWFREMVVKFLHTLEQLNPILYSHFPCLNRHSKKESPEHNWQELGLALLTSKARIPKGWDAPGFPASQPACPGRAGEAGIYLAICIENTVLST